MLFTIMLPVSVALVLTAAFFAASADLEQSKWKLVDTRNAPVTASRQHPVLLTFSGHSLSVQGCNTMRAQFKSDSGKIIASAVASTRKACPDEAAKLDLAIASLIAGASYRIVGDQLILTGPDGAEFEFVKQPVPSKDAKTKFIWVASETKDCTAGVARMKCLQVRESKNAPWRLSYIPIVGFEPTPGIEYQLRIKEDVRPNPPQDASRYVWYLDTVIEQRWVKP